jgi:ribosomal protein L11 methyltransferase
MSWIKLQIDEVSSELTDSLEDALLEAGASSVTYEDSQDQPVYEPLPGDTRSWSKNRISALFTADTNMDQVLLLVSSLWPHPLQHARIEILEDKDWERAWMDNYHPIQVSDDFWIVPSWRDAPDTSATNLNLDPGLAFGSGTHATTFMTLRWLLKQNLSQVQLMDYGCGSGILGVSALLRDADVMWGVDIDPQALQASQQNAEKNGVDDKVAGLYLPEDCPELSADIVVANILAGPLIELAPTLKKLLKPGGKLALSGLIRSQEQGVREAYQDMIHFDHVDYDEEWVCLAGSVTA